VTDDRDGYRSARVQPLCAVCGELAAGECPRCGKPLCGAHAPPADTRCESCEAAFERRTRRWAAATALAAQLAIALPYLVIGRPSVDSDRWLLRMRRMARPRFLRERPRR
jgi:hypothetical protein